MSVLTLSQTTLAQTQASANWIANRAGLAVHQPDLAELLGDLPSEYEWIFARDGSLTALDAQGNFWAGCSLPMLAGQSLLHSLEPSGACSCYLDPTFAGLLQAARDRVGAVAPMLAIIPEINTLRVILATHDFSESLVSHHLWFAAGSQWSNQLRELFDRHIGLVTPVRFIRTKLTDETLAIDLIHDAQQVFSDVLASRTSQLELIRENWPAPIDQNRVLVIAGSQFKLLDDAGTVLLEQLQNCNDGTVNRFDCDDPISASPLSLAQAAQTAGIIIATDIFRADTPNLVRPQTPWITWVTRPAIADHGSPDDKLILADASWTEKALAVGWRKEQITIAGWPTIQQNAKPLSPPHLAIIADTRVIEIPPAVQDLSSHRVLWESIEEQLQRDPLTLNQLDKYLDSRARQIGIDPVSLDRALFIHGLILPAFAQGLARLLISAKLPVRLHGQGWQQLEDFRAHAAGPLNNREDMIRVSAQATALVNVTPDRHSHPIHSLNRIVIEPRSANFIAAARSALTGRVLPSAAAANQSLYNALRQLLDNSNRC